MGSIYWKIFSDRHCFENTFGWITVVRGDHLMIFFLFEHKCRVPLTPDKLERNCGTLSKFPADRSKAFGVWTFTKNSDNSITLSIREDHFNSPFTDQQILRKFTARLQCFCVIFAYVDLPCSLIQSIVGSSAISFTSQLFFILGGNKN